MSMPRRYNYDWLFIVEVKAPIYFARQLGTKVEIVVGVLKSGHQQW